MLDRNRFLVLGGEIVDRRKEILDAARNSFTVFGYKATTIEQVAKIANVGKGTIYTFFKNKEELFEAVVETLILEMKEKTDKIIDPTASFMQNAHLALMKLLQFRERHLLLAKMLEEEKAMQTPVVKVMLLKIEDVIITLISDRLKIAIEKGEICPCNTKHVSYMLFKLYFAFIVDWQLTHEESLNEQEILALFSETIFRGLAKK